jgi:DEAD/DEAH box helicase domain-containing protein
VSTLRACLFLGLRRHFRGNPGHLLIEPQILPDHKQDVRRHYLVLMDAVPGGTGFLKSLFDSKHPDELPGEGIMTVLRLALDALDSCDCRVLEPGKEDTDGCYRCIRAYNLQYKADEISRERGIKLLKAMIAAGEKRERVSGLDDIEVSSLFGSVLEKRFIDRLQDAVVSNGGEWSKSLVKGTLGFRFRMKAEDKRGWEIQLQPKLGVAQSVAIQCQPDFMLCCDDAAVRPVAVFTDGFEYHVHPDKPESRLPDDAAKRRAILESGRYWVWNITWQDLQDGPDGEIALVTTKIREVLQKRLAILKRFGVQCPPVSAAMGNGFGQLVEFLAAPVAEGWTRLAGEAALIPLTVLANKSSSGALPSELLTLHDRWRSGEVVAEETEGGSGEWLHATTLAPGGDLLAMGSHGDVIGNAGARMIVRLRLGDSSAERSAAPYLERWRRWLGLANLLQFSAGFGWFCVSEAAKGTAPDLELGMPEAKAADWSAVLDDLLSSLRPLAERMASAGIPMPEIEVYLEDAPDDCFAEMAWSNAGRRVCLLAGDQTSFGNHWVQAGWTVVSPDLIHEKGVGWLASLLTAADDTDRDNDPKETL